MGRDPSRHHHCRHQISEIPGLFRGLLNTTRCNTPKFGFVCLQSGLVRLEFTVFVEDYWPVDVRN